MNRSRAVSWVGLYGVIATLAAYACVSFSILLPDSLLYQGLNFTGAVGVSIETWVRKDYQPFWLNLIWAGIALVAVVHIIRFI